MPRSARLLPLLLGLLSILAFLAKADIEIFFMKFFNP